MRANHAAELSQMLLQMANFKGVNATQQDLRYEQYQEFCRSLVDFGTKYLQVDDLIAFNNLSAKLSELFNPPVFDEMQEKLIIVNQNLNRYVATHFPHFKEFEDIYDWMKFLNYLVGPKDSEQARSLGSLTGVLFDSLKYESAAAAPIGSTEILDEAREENENSVPLVGRAAAEEVEGAVGIAIATSTLVEAETNDKSPVARKLDFGEADQAEQEFRVNYEEKLKDILKIKEVSENHEATLGNNFGIEKFKSFEEFLEFMRYCGGEIFNSEVILEGWAAEVEGLLSWVQEKLTEEQRLSQQVKEAHDSLLIPLLKEVVAETSFPETHIVQISQYVEPVPTHDYARFADLANQIKLMGRYLANQSIDYEMLLKELEEASLEKERLEAEAEILNNSVIEAEQKSPVDGLAATEGENELEAGGLAEIEKAKAEFSSNQESINSIDNAIRSIQDNISKKSFASKMIIEAYDALVSSMLADLGKYDYLEPQLRSFSEAIKSFVNKEAPVYYYDLKEFIDSFDILLAQVRQVLLEQDVVVWRKIVEQREEAVEQLQENKVALGSKEISPATIVPQEITYERHPLFTEENCAFLKEYEGRLLTSEALESYAPMNPLPPSRSQRKIALHAMSPITPFNPDSKEPEILRVKIETKQAELRKSLQLADDDNSSIVAFANSAKLEGAGKYDFGLPVLPEVLNTKLEREVDLLLHCYVLMGWAQAKNVRGLEPGDVYVTQGEIFNYALHLVPPTAISTWQETIKQYVLNIFRIVETFKCTHPRGSKILILNPPALWIGGVENKQMAIYLSAAALMLYRQHWFDELESKKESELESTAQFRLLVEDVALQEQLQSLFQQEYANVHGRLINAISAAAPSSLDQKALTDYLDQEALTKYRQSEGWEEFGGDEQAIMELLRANPRLTIMSLDNYSQLANKEAERGNDVLQKTLERLTKDWGRYYKEAPTSETEKELSVYKAYLAAVEQIFMPYANSLSLAKHNIDFVDEFVKKLAKARTGEVSGDLLEEPLIELYKLLDKVLDNFVAMPESDYKAQQFLRGEFYVTLVLINNKLELVMKELNDFLEANSLSAAADEAQQTSATSRTSSEDGLPLSEIVALAATTTRILPEGVGTAVSGLATYPGMFVAAPSPKSVHSPTGPLSGVEETKESDKESDNVVVPTHS